MLEKNNYIERVSFSKIFSQPAIPDLLELQKKSYKEFLQMGVLPEKRKNVGIEAAFRTVFPISDLRGNVVLDFVSYSLGDWSCKCGQFTGIENALPVCTNCGSTLSPEEDFHNVCPECFSVGTINYPTCSHCGDRSRLKIKFTPEECLDKGFDYSIPLKVKLRLAIYTENKKGERVIKDIKEQEIYFGEIPYLTERGSFIINGNERVVVSQLQRSPGVYFLPGKTRGEFTAKIIPARGAWIELEEKQNLLQVRLDKKTKRINITTFLKAMGLASDFDILKQFYTIVPAKFSNNIFYIKPCRFLKDAKLTLPVYDEKGNEFLPAGTKLLLKHIHDLEKMNIDYIPVDVDYLEGMYSANDFETILKTNEPITAAQIKKLNKVNAEFYVFFPESEDEELGPMISLTLRKDKKRKEGAEAVETTKESEGEEKITKSQNDAFVEIYKKLKPGDPVTLEGAKKYFENLIFNPRNYDLSSVGRLKVNIKLGLKPDVRKNILNLTLEDMIEIVRYFLKLKYDRTGTMKVDDIDHLANRRIRAVGELVENAFRIGLARLNKVVSERITSAEDINLVLPRELLNTKPIFAALKEFFGTSQMSQFMDQTNPLAETTHKRRISALGPGGLNRERAGFEVRDVHPSHYGRLCPIETPEGQNIGLISSLTVFSRVNDYGFIETPFLKVENGQVKNYYRILSPGNTKLKVNSIVSEEVLKTEIDRVKKEKKKAPEFEYHAFYLTAWEEENFTIAQANALLDEQGRFLSKKVICRRNGETVLAEPSEIDYIDVSPKQIVSLSASLIPFLEHDDANRALMGSNMQRQAVHLISPEPAIVATGMEAKLIKDSGNVQICRRSGTVVNVDAERIIVRVDEDDQEQEADFSRITTDLYQLKKFRRSNQNTMVNQTPLVKVGDKVQKGQVLCDGPASAKGELALGRNVLAAYLPWRGYNFEDAIILSENLVKNWSFNSVYIVEESIEARETKLGKEEITRDIPGVSEYVLRNLDANGIIRIGAKVKPGDILVGKVTPKGETQLSPEEKLLKAIFGEQASEIKDSSLYCPPGVEGTVIDVKIFTRRGSDKDERTKEIDQLNIKKLERNYQDQVKIINIEKFSRIKEILLKEKIEKDIPVGNKNFKKE